jgi:hypothetical protein
LAYEVHRIGEQVKRAAENEAHEREKLTLRLENELLKFERRLPAANRRDE